MVISFEGLHGAPDAPFYFYDKDGFTARPKDGRWLQAQDVSHITDDPAPAIWGDAYTGALELTRTDGGQFSFDSVDVTTWTFGQGDSSGQYTITGLLAGQIVYSASGNMPPYDTNGFITVDSPSRNLVGTVELSFVRGTQAYVVDNIRVIPSPNNGGAPWATEIQPGTPDEAGQKVHFVITANSNPELFAVEPSIYVASNLIFAPRPNARGTATITVELHDGDGRRWCRCRPGSVVQHQYH